MTFYLVGSEKGNSFVYQKNGEYSRLGNLTKAKSLKSQIKTTKYSTTVYLIHRGELSRAG